VDIQVVNEEKPMISVIVGLAAAIMWNILNVKDFDLSWKIISNGGYEKNPLIGKYPSLERLNKFRTGFTAAYLIVYSFCLFVPAAYPVFLPFTLGSLALKVYTVIRNKKVLERLT
jgi:hypothetical protein